MHSRSMHRDQSSKYALDVFGVAFNPVTETWCAFNEDTLTNLSEHETELEAHAACRRYEAAAFRRQTVLTALTNLARLAI
jgi:hypothetical protein